MGTNICICITPWAYTRLFTLLFSVFDCKVVLFSSSGMVVTFCDRLGWFNLHCLLSGFAERLAFGVRRDLTDLIQIDGIDGSRARALCLAGLKTVVSLTTADQQDIIQALKRAVPFSDSK